MSLRVSARRASSACSGAMNSGVPIRDPQTWTTSSNWTSGGPGSTYPGNPNDPANNPGGIAILSSGITALTTINLGSNTVKLNQLQFGTVANGQGQSLDKVYSVIGGTLSFVSVGGTNPSIALPSGTGTATDQEISSPTVLQAGLSINENAKTNLLIQGGLNIGTNTLTVNGNNGFVEFKTGG
jgi:hypothetical protein